MSSVSSKSTRKELLQQSLQEGGYGFEKRRQSWLQLLDLQHLESQLEASTSKLIEPENSLDIDTSNQTSSLLNNEVPLDSEGWQIPQLGHVEGEFENDQQEWEGEEWNIATSKRQKRRKGASQASEAMKRSASATGTGISSAETTETTNSREQSQSRHTTGNGLEADRVVGKGDQKGKKKEKKKKGRIDIEASGILMPTSKVVEDERDESLKQDWIQADGHTNRSERDLIAHRDEQQVALDINRSFIGVKDSKLQELRREQLNEVIIGVLRRHPSLNYYQGYHDIVSAVLLVLVPQAEGITDVSKTLQIVIEFSCRMSLHLLRDNMTVNMEPTMGQLKVLRNLLRKADDEISIKVESASALPYFALPWLISLFAHDLKQDLTVLVFDYILARGPASVIYLCVALILHDKDETSIEDAAEKHHSLSQLPNHISSESLPSILKLSDSLLDQYPVESTTKEIMGPRSTIFTWSQLPLSSNDTQIPTPWSHADALAEAILNGGTENIVIDALPTPPASEDEWSDKEEKRKRRKVSKQGQKGASVLAFVGAVGAVGVAALLMYGAGRGGVSFG